MFRIAFATLGLFLLIVTVIGTTKYKKGADDETESNIVTIGFPVIAVLSIINLFID